MKEEYVDIVDENDKIIVKVKWNEMMDKKLLHRAANVIIFNSKGEIFVNKRASHLRLYPGMWDIKFGGSVRAGETYETATKRELSEETNIKNPKLKFLFKMKTRRKENNVNRTVFGCVVNKKIIVNNEEIEKGQFMTINQIKKLLTNKKLSGSGIDVFTEFLKIKNINDNHDNQ